MIRNLQLLLALSPIIYASPLSSRETNLTDWNKIPSSPSLSWTPCYTNFTCAKLQVPLDYDDPSVGTVDIAFVRWESPKQPAMGDIILNPGGPGLSGVDYLLKSSDRLAGLLGTAYNLVGMDPRGVKNSGPNTDCFAGEPVVRDYWSGKLNVNYDPSSARELLNHWTDAGGYGDWCAQKLNQTARYANTPATARDMLTYIEASADKCGKPKADAKLNYVGTSYGSALGTTFASLFPDRVGRMIINGVVDVEEHYGGSWMRNLRQADAAIARFFELCYDAGRACAFFRNDTSPVSMQKRFDALIEEMKRAPISVSDPRFVQFPAVVTWVDMMYGVLSAVYDPASSFPSLAVVLAQLEQRNATSMIKLMASADLNIPKGVMPPSVPQKEYDEVQAKWIIACNDQHGRYNISSLEKMQKYVSDLNNVSHYLGGIWSAAVTVNCWKHAFVPPQSQIFPGFKETRTANPILFADNTIDPISSFADKMASFYPGSVVLKQKAVGHGLSVAVSNCTIGHVRNYLNTGKLPPAGTLCDIQNPNPFLDGVSGGGAGGSGSV